MSPAAIAFPAVPTLPVQLAAIAKTLVTGAIFVKAGVVVVGYGAYVAASPTGAGTRRDLLGHIKEVLSRSEPESDAPWRSDIKTLRKHLQNGWHRPTELAALTRLLAKVSLQHAVGSAEAAGKIVSSCGKGLWGWSAETAVAIWNFPKKPPDSMA